jgi:hypothetical protein
MTRFFLNRLTFFLSTNKNVPCKQMRIVKEDKRIRNATVTNLWINYMLDTASNKRAPTVDIHNISLWVNS